MYFANNALLKSLSFPKLLQLGNGYDTNLVSGSPLLEEISAPLCVSFRQKFILEDTLLAPLDHFHTLYLPKVETVTTFQVRNISTLVNVDVASIKNSSSSLMLENIPVTSNPFPILETVGTQGFIVAGTQATSLVFPNFRSVTGGSFNVVNNPLVTIISLPSMIDGGTWSPPGNIISGCPLLETFSAPNLQSLAQPITFQNAIGTPQAHLTTINLASLRTAGYLTFLDLPALTTLNLSSLETASHLQVRNAPITALSMTNLKTLTQNLLIQNTSVTSLDFTQMTSAATTASTQITISDNASLTSLTMPALATTRALVATNNPQLSTFTVTTSPAPSVTATTTLSGMPLLCSPPVFTCGTSCSSYDPC